MAGIREQRKQETRKAILEAAVKLFAEKGFEQVSIEDIASQAGIGKTTVYGYFTSKDDIFINYCDEELDHAFSQLQSADTSGMELRDLLVDFFMLKFRFITRNREFGRQMLRAMIFPGEVNEKARIHDQRYFDIIEGYLRRAQERGEISSHHTMFDLSIHFFSLYLGLLAGWYTGYLNSYEETEKAMSTLFQQTIEGIR